VRTVGIDRIIEHAGVAKASLYNLFGSKEELVCAYLESRHASTKERIARTLTRFPTPYERLLGVFDAQGEFFTDPRFNGCAFASAGAEAPPGSSVEAAIAEYRAWVRTLFADLAREAGFVEPDTVAQQLHLLYDGAILSARTDRDATAATRAKVAAAAILDAAPKTERAWVPPATERPAAK
jgi:AcrR family transcriptional regulator